MQVGFNKQWREVLKNRLPRRLKYSIDSSIANRNSIAHGKNVGISYSHAKNLWRMF
jgi:hypothetical protein